MSKKKDRAEEQADSAVKDTTAPAQGNGDSREALDPAVGQAREAPLGGASSSADAGGPPSTAPGPQEQLAALQAEVLDLKDKLLRKQADFENYRKRMIRERDDAARYANAALLSDLIATIDDFERAIRSAEEGHDFSVLLPGHLHDRAPASRDPREQVGPEEVLLHRREFRPQQARGRAAGRGPFRREADSGRGLPEGVLPARACPSAREGEGHGAGSRVGRGQGSRDRRPRHSRPGAPAPAHPRREARAGRADGQDHRDRPRHHQFVRRRHGRQPARGHPQLGGAAHNPVRRRFHRRGRAAGGSTCQEPAHHEPREHGVLHQALHGPSGRGGAGGDPPCFLHRRGRRQRRARRGPRASSTPPPRSPRPCCRR